MQKSKQRGPGVLEEKKEKQGNLQDYMSPPCYADAEAKDPVLHYSSAALYSRPAANVPQTALQTASRGAQSFECL